MEHHTRRFVHRNRRKLELEKEASMKHIVFCSVLLLAGIGVAQQQGQPPPTTSPPYQTPPTFPEGRQTPRAQMPPDTQAPPPQTMSTERVEQQTTQRLSSEPELFKSNID